MGGFWGVRSLAVLSISVCSWVWSSPASTQDRADGGVDTATLATAQGMLDAMLAVGSVMISVAVVVAGIAAIVALIKRAARQA